MKIENTIESISSLAEILKSNGLTEITVKEPGLEITLSALRAAVPSFPNQMYVPPLISAPDNSSPGVHSAEKNIDTPKTADDENYKSVISPLVGTFYRAPAEDKPPFADVGDRVKKGQVLCIIESMKLMNELQSEFDGEITEILIKNGEMVEYGQELFRIK